MNVERLYIHIALSDINFYWKQQELRNVITLWMEGWSLQYISKILIRDPDEIMVLFLDLAEHHKFFNIKRDNLIKVSSPQEMTFDFKVNFEHFLNVNKHGYEAFYGYDVDFIWDSREIRKFRDAWKAGYSIDYMADNLKRNKLDIALLAMDQVREDRIQPRNGGLEGWVPYDPKKSRRKPKKLKKVS